MTSLAAQIVAFVLLAGAATSAMAAPADDAEPLVQEGIAFRTAQQDGKALDKFQRAYKIARTPRIEAQIGAAEQALGRWVDAEAHISEALAAASDGWIAKNRATLEHALGAIRAHLGSLEILGEPAGAEIRIDGRNVGHLPLAAPLHLPVGPSTIEVRLAGYVPVTRKVSIEAEKFTRETVVLEALAAPEPIGQARVAGGTDTTVVGIRADSAPRSTQAEPQPPSSSPAWRTPLAWTLAAGAVAGLGVGVAGLIIRNNKANDYNRLVDMSACAGADATTCADLQSSGNHASVAAVVGFSAAGALALTSAILFLWTPYAPAPVATALRSCTSDVAMRGVVCSLSF